MGIAEPHVRRRGFFFHVETPELDHIEQDSSEGVSVRLRVARPRAERRQALGSSRKPTHAVRTTSLSSSSSEADEGGRPIITLRLASATGSHRQARMSR
jgi:hypothetical protein